MVVSVLEGSIELLLEMKCQAIHFGNIIIQTSVIPISKYIHHIVRCKELEDAQTSAMCNDVHFFRRGFPDDD